MSGRVALLAVAFILAGGAAPRAERIVGTLRVDMAVGKAVFQPGEPIAIVLSVTNTGAVPLNLTMTSAQQYEVFVRQRGALIWQWSHDKAFAQVVRDAELTPGGTLSFQVTWDQRDLQGRRVEPGPYDISCLFLGAQRSGPRSVEVGPIRISVSR